MFKGTLPQGQPRTLRTIAEKAASPSHFTSESMQPQDHPVDQAAKIAQTPDRGLTSGDKQPFANLRSGR